MSAQSAACEARRGHANRRAGDRGHHPALQCAGRNLYAARGDGHGGAVTRGHRRAPDARTMRRPFLGDRERRGAGACRPSCDVPPPRPAGRAEVEADPGRARQSGNAPPSPMTHPENGAPTPDPAWLRRPLRKSATSEVTPSPLSGTRPPRGHPPARGILSATVGALTRDRRYMLPTRCVRCTSRRATPEIAGNCEATVRSHRRRTPLTPTQCQPRRGTQCAGLAPAECSPMRRDIASRRRRHPGRRGVAARLRQEPTNLGRPESAAVTPTTLVAKGGPVRNVTMRDARDSWASRHRLQCSARPARRPAEAGTGRKVMAPTR